MSSPSHILTTPPIAPAPLGRPSTAELVLPPHEIVKLRSQSGKLPEQPES